MVEDPISTIHRLLTEYCDLPLRIVGEGEPGATGGWDAVFEGPGVTFLIEYKRSGSTEDVSSALRHIERRGPRRTRWIPILAVPYMGEVGKELCRLADVAWLDLSGNARIITPRLRIWIEGKPNRFAQRGRPSDPFAPKASRISRALLLNPQTPFSQSDLAGATGLEKGFVSRIVQRLEAAALISREQNFVLVPDPARLLAAWRASYDFSRHEILRFAVASRSGADTVRRVTEGLTTSFQYALTGLAAAWAYAPFASFRTAAIYVERRPDSPTLKSIGATETAGGANLWLVVPNDAGVFMGANEVSGARCVSALQTYLDLKGQPERAEEAAEELRRVHLPWAAG